MKIDVIGHGNVGWHLAKAWKGKADVAIVKARGLEGLRLDSDLYVIAVPDRYIETVGKSLRNALPNPVKVAHTSGTAPLSILGEEGGLDTGVFYPLQTFSKEVSLDYSTIPVFIEGSPGMAETLKDAASLWTAKIRYADSNQRKKLHLASVIASNFANHLWGISKEILNQSGLFFDYLEPLLRETLNKAVSMDPYKTQTGPASRNDMTTVSAHLEMLELMGSDVNHFAKDIYSLISKSIIHERYKL